MRDRFVEWWGKLDKRLFAVIVTTVAVRLLWIATVRAQPVSDFLFYFLAPGEVAAGKGYLFNGHPTAYWPPGYPFVLAVFFKLFGSTLIVAQLLNVAMWTASAWLHVRARASASADRPRVSSPGSSWRCIRSTSSSPGSWPRRTSSCSSSRSSRSCSRVEPVSPRQAYCSSPAARGLLLGWGILTRPASVLLPLTHVRRAVGGPLAQAAASPPRS